MTRKLFGGIKMGGPFCPSWGVLVDTFQPDGRRYEVAVGSIVLVQFRKYESDQEAKVVKIVADKESGEPREVTVVMSVDPQFRTVTPDKIRRVPKNRQEEEEDMKISAFKGDLPKTPRGGKRQPNPFDEAVAEGGKHVVALDKGEDVKKLKAAARAAAKFIGKSIETSVTDEGPHGTLYFEVVAPKTRSKAADAE